MNLIINLFINHLDVIAFILSVINIIYSYSQSKIRLKVKFKLTDHPVLENEHYHFLLNCTLFNRSKYPITISKVELNGCKAYNHKVHLGDGSETVFNQEIYGEGNTQELPFKLELFDSKDATFLIRDRKQLKLHHINVLKIYTSRGTSYYLKFKWRLK